MKRKDTAIENFKTIVTYSAIGLGTATGLIFLSRYLYKKGRTKLIDKKSLNEGDPATYARQLKMAFDNDNWFGWGTNTKLVMQVFEDIPSKASYQKVQKAYFGLYNKNLNADLENELSSSEYNQVIQILSAKK